MKESERALYQFMISHYCEKSRWCLDAKGLDYEVREIIPGLHRVMLKRFGGAKSVPVLVDGGTALTDSTEIARHLDRRYPDRPLFPSDPALRARAEKLEEYFDTTAGVAVRQWIYGSLVHSRSGAAAEAMFSFYPLALRMAGKVVAPFIERALRKMYRLSPPGVDAAETRISESLDRIECETDGDPARYLVGERLTIADITAASLLAPIVGPPGAPWEKLVGSDLIPARVKSLRASLAARPGWAWVKERYIRDRRQPRAMDRAA